MNNLITKILTEWSYRVHDGMPNPKNPLHLVELKHLLIERRFPYQFVDALLTELEFSDKGDFQKYKSKHKMRKSTKVDIGGKETTVGDVDGDKEEGSSEEQIKKEKEKQEFLLDMADGLLLTSTETKGTGRFNMSKEDLGKYKSYLEGNKPEIPNYDISDDEVNEIIGVLKSTLGENYQKFVQRVRKKGDPPKQYSTGEAGKERFYSCLKHYMQTGGRSTITGEFVPFSEYNLIMLNL